MNKICTDIRQSKKLIELGIDVNTADMYYMYRHWEIDENTIGSQSDAFIGFDLDFYCGADNSKTYHYIPAWSLSALLDILAKETRNIDEDGHVVLSSYKGNWWNISPINCVDEGIKGSKDPLDAAFEMVCWLLENKKI